TTSYFSLHLSFFFFQFHPHPPDLHSFPTRRSSDLYPPATCRGLSPSWRGPATLSSWTIAADMGRAWSSTPGSCARPRRRTGDSRSEEHTSELQSLAYLVCRLLLEKKKKKQKRRNYP